MFERFTEQARQVVVHGQDEARRLRHNFIGTEHILLGLSSADTGTIAARVLDEVGVEVNDLRDRVQRMVPMGGEVVVGQMPFTPRTKTVLELALREALAMGHNYIGTEHILLALVREGGGVGARMLAEYAEPETIRNKVLELLIGDAGRSAVAQTPRVPSVEEITAALDEALASVEDPQRLVGQHIPQCARAWAKARGLPWRETTFAPHGRLFVIGAVPVKGILFP